MKQRYRLIRKIVDTVPNYGAAEQYISFSVIFKKFLRNKYDIREIKEINALDIVDKYHLKGLVFGNYVTQEERYFFLFKISNQLELLAKIKGSNNLGFDILTIAFGANGKKGSLAHFNADNCLINLNRGRKTDYKYSIQGEDSFIHEYGHFLDFIIGYKNAAFNFNFASESIIKTTDFKINNIISAVKKATSNIEYMNFLSTQQNSEYLQSEVEVWARLFEATITHIVNKKYPKYSRFFDRSYKEPRYLSKDFILKNNIDKNVSYSLKNLTMTSTEKKRFNRFI